MRQHVEKGFHSDTKYTVLKGFGEARFTANQISLDTIHEILAYILTFNTTINGSESKSYNESPSDEVGLQSRKSGARNNRNFHTNRVLNKYSNALTNNLKIKIIIENDDGTESTLNLKDFTALIKLLGKEGKY
jgi:dynactin complex subunit